jgi:hypothetical protein
MGIGGALVSPREQREFPRERFGSAASVASDAPGSPGRGGPASRFSLAGAGAASTRNGPPTSTSASSRRGGLSQSIALNQRKRVGSVGLEGAAGASAEHIPYRQSKVGCCY